MTLEGLLEEAAVRRQAAAAKKAGTSRPVVTPHGIVSCLAASGIEAAKCFAAAQTAKQKKGAKALRSRKEREHLQAEEDRLLRLAQATPAGSPEWRRYAAVRTRRVAT